MTAPEQSDKSGSASKMVTCPTCKERVRYDAPACLSRTHWNHCPLHTKASGEALLAREAAEGYNQEALDAASREVHMMLLREGSSWGTKACEEMGRVFMTAYRKALTPVPECGTSEPTQEQILAGLTAFDPTGHPAKVVVAVYKAMNGVRSTRGSSSDVREALESVISEVSWFVSRKKNLAEHVDGSERTWADVLNEDLDIGRNALSAIQERKP